MSSSFGGVIYNYNPNQIFSNIEAGINLPDTGVVGEEFSVGYKEFRILDKERPRIPRGQGRILKVSIWYPVDHEDLEPNTPHAEYDGGWLLPGDFIPDNEILDDITSGKLSNIPPPFVSSIAFDGSNLQISSKKKFQIIIVTPSATIPLWTFAQSFAEISASHGFVIIGVEGLIGDGWRSRLGFGPSSDRYVPTYNNRISDIKFIADLFLRPEKWTNDFNPDPATDFPNNFPELVNMRNSLDKTSFGIATASNGGVTLFENAFRGDPRLKCISGFHTKAYTLSPEQLSLIKIPVFLNSAELDTVVPANLSLTAFNNLGGDRYLIETLGATHFDGISCESAEGFFRISAQYMTGSAQATSNTFANIFNSLCLNQTDISSDEISYIYNRYAIAFFKSYLGKEKNYKNILKENDVRKNNLPALFYRATNQKPVVNSSVKSNVSKRQELIQPFIDQLMKMDIKDF